RFRELWERTANEHLKRAGLAVRIDRRTLKAQGIDREAGIHVGPRGMAVERKGLTPASRIVEGRRFNEGSAGPIWLDYGHIDHGRTRAQENNARRQRNALRSETFAPWKSLFVAAQEVARRQRGPPDVGRRRGMRNAWTVDPLWTRGRVTRAALDSAWPMPLNV